jgi:alpha-mannosidase
MRIILSLLLVAILLPTTLFTQPATIVDRVTAALDTLSSVTFDGWRMSPDLKSYHPAKGHPADPGFDDSGWEILTIGRSVYPDSCWLRKEIVVPGTILGLPVSGPLLFLISVDDYGYFWVNGELRGTFPWNGQFELTPDARPGQHILVAVKAVNTGGPLRLLRAELRSTATKATRQLIEDFSLSLQTGQKLLSFDTYQTSAWRKADPKSDRSSVPREEKVRLNTLLQSAAGRVDVDALRGGSLDRFTESVEAVRVELKPVAEFAKRFTLFFDANAHIDAAWLWREKETIELAKNTFSSVLNMMQQRPDFTYTQSSAAYYDWMERLYPDIFRGMARQIKDGRWEPIGGMWVEPDCNIPSGESWARHLLYAKRYFKEKFGIDIAIGWNPDSFGYNASMPMFYRNAGIDAFITQKIGWNDTNVFPYRLFWWESPDGSRILSYFPFDYVNTVDQPFRLVDWLRQYEANTGLQKLMVLFGVGDHGGGPSLEMLARIDRLGQLDIFPRIEHGTASQYLRWVRTQDLSALPVWRDELYLEYHQGTYTTQAAVKEANRTSETLLTNAEKFSSLASLYGRPYNGGDLEEAWKKILFNQFHDILPGSSIHEVYIDAAQTFKEAREIGEFELHGALASLASRITTSGFRKESPLIVFNSLAWPRTDLVRHALPYDGGTDYAVFDEHGMEIPCQLLTRGKYDRELLFIARDIPSLGYRTYEIRRQKPGAIGSVLTAADWQIASDMFSVTVDPSTGWISSIKVTASGRELLSGPGNQLQLLEDLPTEYDAWNIGWTGVQFPTKFRSGRVIEQGPVRTVLRLERDYLKPGRKKEFPTEDFPTSFFTQDIILYDGLDRIDFVTRADWWEDRTMLKVAFPLSITDTVATYEIPYGTIRRSTQLRNSWEKAKVEVPASRWADVSNDDFGVSLLNAAKYGYDVKGNTLRLSLLRSPKSPDPMADRGKHTMVYALYPHKGRWESAQTLRRGYELNTPLIAFRAGKAVSPAESRVAGRMKGALPSRSSFVRLSPEPLVLTSIKKAEGSAAWVIQWYNPGGSDVDAVLELPRVPIGAVMSNFLEEDGAPTTVEGAAVHVKTKARGVVTIKCTFQELPTSRP